MIHELGGMTESLPWEGGKDTEYLSLVSEEDRNC